MSEKRFTTKNIVCSNYCVWDNNDKPYGNDELVDLLNELYNEKELYKRNLRICSDELTSYQNQYMQNETISHLKEKIVEQQATIIALREENEQLKEECDALQKKTEVDKNDFFISEAKRMRLLAFIEDKELQKEYSEWERRIWNE